MEQDPNLKNIVDKKSGANRRLEDRIDSADTEDAKPDRDNPDNLESQAT